MKNGEHEVSVVSFADSKGSKPLELKIGFSFVSIDNAKMNLEQEMKELNLTDVSLDEHCYVYGKLPATEGLEDKPAIGFIAHMDTVSDFCDHEIRPVITENYDGKDLPLQSVLHTPSIRHRRAFAERNNRGHPRNRRLLPQTLCRPDR